MHQHLPHIVDTVWQQQALILTAEPGSGKTTQVPWALASHQLAPKNKQVWVLEPRRLAARMAAQYVASGLSEPVGGRVGYRVRHDDATGPRTQVVYMTEGLLWRTLLGAPTLPQVACVIFDEFHGRTLAGDLILAALAYRRSLGQTTPAIVVMSATLAQDDVRRLLPEAPHVHVPGRQYPVDVHHAAQMSRDRLEVQMARSVAQVLGISDHAGPAPGHILAFLPGVADIERTRAACAGLAARHNMVVAPLHASLPAHEQDRAVAPCAQRRLVLATNVAETSLTIDNVTHVIDSGLAKLPDVDPLTGIGRLRTAAISQAAAVQRAGRAGRTGPGTCLRLFTAANFRMRAPFEDPELVRSDLCEAVLWLGALKLPGLAELPLIDAPALEAIAQAEAALARLGAWHEGAITDLGHQLLDFAVHPRLARVILGGHATGISDLVCRAAAVLSLGSGAKAANVDPAACRHAVGHSDLEPMCAPQAMTQEAKRAAAGLRAALKGPVARKPSASMGDPMMLLEAALLLGFSDRLVRRLPPLGPRPGVLPLALGWGGKGALSSSSCVRDSPLMLALMAAERGGAQTHVTVDVAHSVAAESLITLDDGRLQEHAHISVSEQHGRVEKVETLSYDGLLIDESRSQHVAAHEAQAALSTWLHTHPKAALQQVMNNEDYPTLLGRLAFVAANSAPGVLFAGGPSTVEGAQAIEAELGRGLLGVMREVSATCRSTAQLMQAPLYTLLVQALTQPWQQALRTMAPKSITLASKRTLVVSYPIGQAPFVGSYLQDFFGSSQGPLLGPQRLPLTLHLWGPNKRALQVTQDLARFWSAHYPKLRPALARKYPRHSWPDDPITAQPPPPRPPRRR